MHELPLQMLGGGSDLEALLRDCAGDHAHMRRVLCELREAVLEQVGEDQTDRLRRSLADAVKSAVSVIRNAVVAQSQSRRGRGRAARECRARAPK